MQTAMTRHYDDPSYSRLAAEAPIPRAEAMDQILAGFRAALNMEFDPDAVRDLGRSLFIEWAGYDLYEPAAPIGQEHVTRVRLRPAAGGHRFEYVFPGGLTVGECDALCCSLVSDGDQGDQEREWLVIGTLAGMLHASGTSLSDDVIDLVHGQTCITEGFVIVPTVPPTTLHAGVRARGWAATAELLRDVQATVERRKTS